MGSVGRDYQCPWCGRVGHGGYAPDPLFYPICTDGPHNCLDRFCAASVSGATDMRTKQLKVIFHGRSEPQLQQIVHELMPRIAIFLSDGSD